LYSSFLALVTILARKILLPTTTLHTQAHLQISYLIATATLESHIYVLVKMDRLSRKSLII
jgi:hypothetical protein